MHSRKLIFLDLDGTIIDHKNNEVPQSTVEAIKSLQSNGHVVAIATGRPPSLFYGIDKMLNINTFIAANGRFVQHNERVLLHDYIDINLVKRFVLDMNQRGLDVGFESKDDYATNSKTTVFPDLFSECFHLEKPKVIPDFHLNNKILQMVLFTDSKDMSYLQEMYPEFAFNYSCPYGIDVNLKNGMKDLGIDILCNYLNIDIKDTIAVGDGHNDITMIQKAHIGVAMGNARDELKAVADYVTADCHDHGIQKIFKKLNLI